MIKRPSIEEYMMNIAYAAAQRSTCPRAKVGAVICRLNDVVAIGYNGSPHNTPHCEDVGCVLDNNGKCIRTIHAELNALLKLNQLFGDEILYCTHLPCLHCCHIIINLQIKTVIYDKEYKDFRLGLLEYQNQIHYLEKFGVVVRQYHPDSREKVSNIST